MFKKQIAFFSQAWKEKGGKRYFCWAVTPSAVDLTGGGRNEVTQVSTVWKSNSKIQKSGASTEMQCTVRGGRSGTECLGDRREGSR